MDSPLSPGTKLGRYEIRSKIGAGGMGEVYLAQDSKLDRKVALKILPAEVAADRNRMSRFVQEAKTASALNHPNIITIYEIEQIDSVNFIATEFIDGETLREHMRNAMKIGEVLDVAAQIASALSAAHTAGIVHRDIKPENIMRRRDGIVKVLDFGLAKMSEKTDIGTVDPEAVTKALVQTEPGAVMGTVAYMSPGQVRGVGVDARTDIFSLGVVIYELVAGRVPFSGATRSDLIVALLEREPPPLAHFAPEAPAELERIVNKALRKDPDERYQTAKDLLIDLRQLRKRLEFGAELERTKSPDRRPAPPKETSIAVLPFANMSNDAENDYFCDGLAEELLNALAKIEDLKVAARTSAFSFKGKNVNVSEIGNILGVKTVLEGSVRKSGNRLRITVQLVNAADGYHLWSERYDREMKDIFDVQDEITLAVMDALKVKLLGKEKAVLLKRYTDNTEAYELYLKGRYHLHKHTAEGWRKAIEFFERVIKNEPEYAPAYASLSSVLAFCLVFGVLSADETVPKWKAATVRALEIDYNLDEAHTAFGQLHFYYEWNWDDAEREYLRAIAINPNNAEVHHQYGLFLACVERFGEAISEGLRALELDPISLLVNLQIGWIYLHAGRLDDVIRQDQNMLEIEPNFQGAYWQMGIAYVAKGAYEEALEAYQKALALGSYQHVLSSIGAVCADLGRRDEALDVLNQLLEMRQRQPVTAFNIARVYSSLGEIDKAIEWLGKAVEERNGELVFLKVETRTGTGHIFGNDIRKDPRFADLVRRIGLPE